MSQYVQFSYNNCWIYNYMGLNTQYYYLPIWKNAAAATGF